MKNDYLSIFIVRKKMCAARAGSEIMLATVFLKRSETPNFALT